MCVLLLDTYRVANSSFCYQCEDSLAAPGSKGCLRVKVGFRSDQGQYKATTGIGPLPPSVVVSPSLLTSCLAPSAPPSRSPVLVSSPGPSVEGVLLLPPWLDDEEES